MKSNRLLAGILSASVICTAIGTTSAASAGVFEAAASAKKIEWFKGKGEESRFGNKLKLVSGNRNSINSLISKQAAAHGVPTGLARAVVKVESNFRPDVTGRAGEIGLMQIKLATARGMGYRGSRQNLYDPATNIYWGMKYLGKAHQLAGGSTCGTIMKYQGGHGAKKMSSANRKYCNRVKQIMN